MFNLSTKRERKVRIPFAYMWIANLTFTVTRPIPDVQLRVEYKNLYLKTR